MKCISIIHYTNISMLMAKVANASITPPNSKQQTKIRACR